MIALDTMGRRILEAVAIAGLSALATKLVNKLFEKKQEEEDDEDPDESDGGRHHSTHSVRTSV